MQDLPGCSTFAHLQYLGETGKVCKTVKGTMEGTFVLGTEKWELDLASAKGQSKTVGAATLTITSVKSGDGECEIGVNIKSPRGNDSSGHDAIVYTVLAADGSKWRQGSGGGGGFVGNLNYTYSFKPTDDAKDRQPAKLLVEVPTGMSREEVPFEFHDLPLP